MNQLGAALTEYRDPAGQLLFVYNCNPAATMPDQTRVLRGLEREDLFTVVFEQVLTDTVPYADVVLPATTFLEHYDFAKGVRADHACSLTQPVIEPVGEARSNADVFGDLGRRLGLFDEERGARRARFAAARARTICPAEVGSDLKATGVARRHGTARLSSSWTCSRGPRTGKCTSSPRISIARRPPGSTATSQTRRPTASRWP